jgi:hypothetical protein
MTTDRGRSGHQFGVESPRPAAALGNAYRNIFDREEMLGDPDALHQRRRDGDRGHFLSFRRRRFVNLLRSERR